MAKINKSMAHFLCLVLMCATCVSGQYQHFLDSLNLNVLYENIAPGTPTQYLPNADSEYVSLQLSSPLNFYTEKYEQIFVSFNKFVKYEQIIRKIIESSLLSPRKQKALLLFCPIPSGVC